MPDVATTWWGRSAFAEEMIHQSLRIGNPKEVCLESADGNASIEGSCNADIPLVSFYLPQGSSSLAGAIP